MMIVEAHRLVLRQLGAQIVVAVAHHHPQPHAYTASWICRLASASRSSGVFFARHASSARPTMPEAVSRNRPIGRPALSLRISPPAGSGVLPVSPAAAMTAALTKLAWPLACVSITGLFGDTLLSPS